MAIFCHQVNENGFKTLKPTYCDIVGVVKIYDLGLDCRSDDGQNSQRLPKNPYNNLEQ